MTPTSNYKDTISKIFNEMLGNHPELVEEAINFRREELNEIVCAHFDNTVAYGPFKGLRISNNPRWGRYDKASMIMGIYEREILKELEILKDSNKVFIDVGAADGYYGIGAIYSNFFKHSYLFEASDAGQKLISENAKLNGIEDRVFIKGTAESDFYLSINGDDAKNSVVLIDIEGAEFEIVNSLTFEFFKNSSIIIELHDWFYENANALKEKLISDGISTHRVREVRTNSRDLSTIPEVSSLSDTNRWLLCSEGRGRLMSWLIFDPLIR